MRLAKTCGRVRTPTPVELRRETCHRETGHPPLCHRDYARDARPVVRFVAHNPLVCRAHRLFPLAPVPDSVRGWRTPEASRALVKPAADDGEQFLSASWLADDRIRPLLVRRACKRHGDAVLSLGGGACRPPGR